MGKPSAMHLYNGLGLFDRFVPYGGRGIVDFLDTVSLSERGALSDRGIVLPHSFRSALLLLLASVGKTGRIRPEQQGLLLTETVPDVAGRA